MSKLEDIEKAIAQLSPGDLARLRAWLEELEGRLLDEMIERDVKSGKSGKLEKLAAKAIAEHKAGRSRRL
jgi:hypothetical protein